MKISVLRDRAEKSGIKDVEIDAALDMGHEDGHDALIDLILIAEEQVGLDRCDLQLYIIIIIDNVAIFLLLKPPNNICQDRFGTNIRNRF
eukprot:COSAG06_NODE_5116_length_3711_cov_2.390642_3_plen_90_part_00